MVSLEHVFFMVDVPYVDWRVRVVATSRNGTESIQEASSAIIFPF